MLRNLKIQRKRKSKITRQNHTEMKRTVAHFSPQKQTPQFQSTQHSQLAYTESALEPSLKSRISQLTATFQQPPKMTPKRNMRPIVTRTLTARLKPLLRRLRIRALFPATFRWMRVNLFRLRTFLHL